MTASIPITFHWTDDGVMKPLDRFAKVCDKQFVVGETYRLTEQEERSAQSHRHFFAQIEETWRNLPDAIAMQFATSEILRKHSLIMTGWFHERRFASSSPLEARKIAAFLVERKGEYALISVAGNVVIERIARSQSTRGDGMRKAEFQKSKQDVLNWISELIGVKPETLAAETGKAA